MLEKKTDNDFNKILIENIKENNKMRRNNFYIKLFTFILLCFFLFSNSSTIVKSNKYHTAIIRIEGEISPNSNANASHIIQSLKKAYTNKYVKGIILKINSGGGSGVQAQMVYKELNRLKKKYPHIHLYSVIEDIGASAAYLIACGTNKIYADEMSIVGSIGVLIDTFGFHNVLEKLGIERRLYTSGKFKGLLDPYSKMDDEKKKIINYQLKILHKEFIKKVIKGRNNSLKLSPLIFSGLTWTGSDALNIGLIDGFADTNYISRNIINSKYIVDYTFSKDIFSELAQKFSFKFFNNFTI